jgi:hypothetical protein
MKKKTELISTFVDVISKQLEAFKNQTSYLLDQVASNSSSVRGSSSKKNNEEGFCENIDELMHEERKNNEKALKKGLNQIYIMSRAISKTIDQTKIILTKMKRSKHLKNFPQQKVSSSQQKFPPKIVLSNTICLDTMNHSPVIKGTFTSKKVTPLTQIDTPNETAHVYSQENQMNPVLEDRINQLLDKSIEIEKTLHNIASHEDKMGGSTLAVNNDSVNNISIHKSFTKDNSNKKSIHVKNRSKSPFKLKKEDFSGIKSNSKTMNNSFNMIINNNNNASKDYSLKLADNKVMNSFNDNDLKNSFDDRVVKKEEDFLNFQMDSTSLNKFSEKIFLEENDKLGFSNTKTLFNDNLSNLIPTNDFNLKDTSENGLNFKIEDGIDSNSIFKQDFLSNPLCLSNLQ